MSRTAALLLAAALTKAGCSSEPEDTAIAATAASTGGAGAQVSSAGAGGAPVGTGGGGAAGAGGAPPAPASVAPLLLYYGAYEKNGQSPATLSLLGTHEPVLAINRPLDGSAGDPGTGAEFVAWRAGGGKVAHVESHAEIGALLDAGTAVATLASWIAAGFDYVAIDEVAVGPNVPVGWKNGEPFAAAFVKLLADLAASGLDRRVILFVNAYNLAGTLHEFSDVLSACRDHCRVLGSEIYVHTDFVFEPGAEAPGKCNRSTDCFESLATELETAAPGISGRTITVLGVSDVYTGGEARALCDAPGGIKGSLYKQYSKLHQGAHTKLQPGVGGYTIAAVAKNSFWGPEAQAGCLHGLNGWIGWPDASGP